MRVAHRSPGRHGSAAEGLLKAVLLGVISPMGTSTVDVGEAEFVG